MKSKNNSPEKRLIKHLLCAFDQYQINLASERNRRGLIKRKKNHKYENR